MTAEMRLSRYGAVVFGQEGIVIPWYEGYVLLQLYLQSTGDRETRWEFPFG